MSAPPPYPGTPRWVRIAGTILIALVLLVLVLMFTRGPGGQGHGPGLHGAARSGEAVPDRGR